MLKQKVAQQVRDGQGARVIAVPTLPYCTVLYCTVLHCTVLHCTALYYNKIPVIQHTIIWKS